jgi:tetratricopeptide (TPR) repeat protein
MRVFLDAGRRGAALRLYEDYARRLRSELGIDPPRSMAELRHRVRTEPLATPESIDRGADAFRSACERRRDEEIERTLDPLCREMDRRGLYRNAIALLDDALATIAEGPLSGKILARQGALLSCVGQLAKARALLEAGLRSARETKDPVEVGYCENRLGAVLFAQGHYSRSRRLLRSSVERYREAGSRTGLAWALNVLGHLSIGSREARPILGDCLARGRRARDEARVASAWNSLGKEALSRGIYERARKDLERSLVLRREQGHRIGIADSLNNLARAWLLLGDIRSSRRALEEAHDLSRAIDAGPLVAEVLLSIAAVHRASGEAERSARAATSALRAPGAWHDARQEARKLLGALTTNETMEGG